MKDFRGLSPEITIVMTQTLVGDPKQPKEKCEMSLKPDDYSNPSLYGRCEIEHGKSVTWFMADDRTVSRF